MCSSTTPVIAEEARFNDAHDHLLAELRLLKQLLHRQVLRLRASGRLVENAFRGLFVADEHVDSILARVADGFAATDLAARIAQQKRELDSRLKATVAAGISLPVDRLSDLLNLTAFERSVIAACAATELDLDFETLYAYVQNDVNRKRPTADLLLKLFADTPDQRTQFRESLAAEGALLKWGIVRPSEAMEKSPFLSRGFKLDDRVMEFLLDRDGIDARLSSFARIVRGGLKMGNVLIPEDLKKELCGVAARFEHSGGIIVLHGAEGVGKRTIAAALSVLQGRGLICADLSRAVAASLPLPEILALLKRETLLSDANLFLEHSESIAPQQLGLLEQAAHSKVVFVAAESPEFSLGGTNRVAAFTIPTPSHEHRLILWHKATARSFPDWPFDDLGPLARKFTLTGGQIQKACESAALAVDVDEPPTIDLLESAVRSQGGRGLARLAPKVDSKQSWTDLVLPARTLQQLRAIATAHRFRHQVYATWGFEGKAAMGKGLNILFFGPSGTGKTMAAGILANGLSLDLYKIDLSRVVSKYVGETEKQLSQIFREAQSSHAILLFDEADALFGKRSEVKDAHDRYANVETAYLLQKMEEYDGIVILTTNFRNNIDEAFSRRLHHIVEFPFPDAANRLHIWKGLIPASAPVAEDADFGFLSRQFELSGGNIRNALVGAAFLAAEESSPIRMSHLIVSTAREMQKLGRIPSKSDFREYFDLIHS